MIIKKMSCEQFAGIRDRDFTLSDGINVIVGPNEAGKSTMVDLMYQLFFQDVKFRRGSSFQELYFPKKASGYAGDSVDGAISFETENGTYKLKKEWAVSGGSCRLTLPDGTIIRDNSAINQILGEQLVYGRGVYDEMVFASQKRALTILQALFQPTALKGRTKADPDSVKSELSATVTRAVMETGGISMDRLESRLAEILLKYDENWDFAADLPKGGIKRGIRNKWACATSAKSAANNLAVILRAYYDVEELAEQQRQAREAENQAELVNQRLESAKLARAAAVARREEFLKYRDVLKNRGLLYDRIADARKSQKELMSDLEKWPEAVRLKKQAETLKKAYNDALCRELYEKVSRLQQELKNKQAEADALGAIDDTDVENAVELEREIAKYKAQLQGLNLTAKIRRLGTVSPEVRTAGAGTEVPIENGTFSIREAVDITVPGIMELSLMPAGVDVDAVRERLSADRAAYEAILEKYSAENADELQKRQMTRKALDAEIVRLESGIQVQLQGASWEDLQTAYGQLSGDVTNSADVMRRIRTLCGIGSIDAFIGRQDGVITSLAEKYGSPEQLEELIDEKLKKIETDQAELDSMDEVPEEYRSIQDVTVRDKKLKDAVEACEAQIEELKTELSRKERLLGEHTAEEYQELLEEKRAYFEKQKDIYSRWKHISDVVHQVKESSAVNPMEDIESRFREYLGMLTANRIALGSINEKLDTSITSGNNQMTYEILSEGTKETIALAFRLAVLNHLFPDGGGVAVFDDPFTDMDAERKAQACTLLKAFAKDNQVIFVTCDSGYSDLLGGKTIDFEA